MKTILLAMTVVLAVAARGPADEAADLARQGLFREAAVLFQQKAASSSDPVAVFKARLNAAACLKQTGDICRATEVLWQAIPLLERIREPFAELLLLAELGSVQSLSRRPSEALPVLRRALAIARDAGQRELEAEILNDLGLASSGANRLEDAFLWYRSAVELARQSDLEDLEIRARQNQLAAAFALADGDRRNLRLAGEAGAWTDPLLQRAERSAQLFDECFRASSNAFANRRPGSSLPIFEAITAGIAAVRLDRDADGFALLRAALDAARANGDPLLERAALIPLAEFYLERGRTDDTRLLLNELRALHPAATPEHETALEILTARMGRLAGDPAGVQRKRLRRAVRLAEELRADLSGSRPTSDLGRGFREWTGAPYLMLAELELNAGRPADAAAAMETFKTWELDDFYRNDCVDLVRETTRDLRAIDQPGTAVLHLLTLDTRTVMLLTTASGTISAECPLPTPELFREARQFRHKLEFDYGSWSFAPHAEALHQALIEPVKRHLTRERIRHLAIIPDGPLAGIPFSALRDAQRARFLIEDMSVSVAPGLSLVPASPDQPGAAGVLLAGLSEAVDGFGALPAVVREIQGIADLHPSSPPPRLNADFSREAVLEAVAGGNSPVIHLATHAEFAADADGTFLLARNGRISMDDLEAMIRPRKFVGTPVDLLVLSACRTAAGDDRAALGLAGAAVKSGARTVVASLWQVEDEASSDLMVSFHRRLASRTGGKAEALRQAQLEAMRGDAAVHPYYWASFILIGDWQ